MPSRFAQDHSDIDFTSLNAFEQVAFRRETLDLLKPERENDLANMFHNNQVSTQHAFNAKPTATHNSPVKPATSLEGPYWSNDFS